MEQAVQIFAAVHSLIMGLSHIFLPRAWAEFFLLLREKGQAGAFVNGFLSLGFGSIIVAFHNVWSGPATVLTVLGWLQVLKALLIFVVPGYGMKGLSLVSLEKAGRFVAAGVVLLILGLYLVWLVAAGR